jgi:hypothetical protein
LCVYRKENETGSQAKVRIEIGEDGEEYNYDGQENPGKNFAISASGGIKHPFSLSAYRFPCSSNQSHIVLLLSLAGVFIYRQWKIQRVCVRKNVTRLALL